RVPVAVAGDGEVTGSARQLGQAVVNVLDNAARHAASRVAVTVAGGRVTVDDDGPGIPEAERERVFERFTRLDEGRTRDAGGAGLGLSIVRAVVARHDGRVWVEDSPFGGARFVLDLPAPTAGGGDPTAG
ncbi:MAG: two-component sensor histidine kinase, partial [Acidimicrobiia bacterium]|nr:two-component sensor histidine kinase [Acidimicrobiia bacterium]